jgi:acyl-CoA synthetase (AMP-forming)/AMP-acid ligase II
MTMTPMNALFHQETTQPDGIAFIYDDVVWTYHDLLTGAERLSRAFLAHGVRPGDRVVLHMPNSPEMAIAVYACFRIGAIACPTNLRFKTAELREVFQRLQPALYLGEEQLYSYVETIESEILANEKRFVIGTSSAYKGARPWSALLAGRVSAGPLLPESDKDAPALLLTTSGTKVVGALREGLQPGPVTRIAPGARIRLVDDEGRDVPRGEVGEFLVRGPYVTVGYWAGPDRIDDATRDGWYHSGDLMRQGEGDELWFVGRKKDLIIRGGSNISPVEVERVLLSHPLVREAVVFGIPDPVLGQRVAAVVQLSSGAGNAALGAILKDTRRQLADYKAPERLWAVDAVPRGPLGKVDRRAAAATATLGRAA